MENGQIPISMATTRITYVISAASGGQGHCPGSGVRERICESIPGDSGIPEGGSLEPTEIESA